MKTNILFPILFTTILTMGSLSCSEGEDPVDTYIPDLSAAGGWENVNNAADELFFLTLPPAGSASGNFDGNRSPGTANSTTFTGTYSYSSITAWLFANMSDRPFTGSINGSSNPVTFTISTPAKGSSPAISLTYKKR